ncbi:MAG TPA: glutamine--fructose-6-phosphate transaminase (isomerizing), partial [Spirochaetota bacterium]|nr:glutamine--fructose-6-phosphate transaminase (isomerizing) [Spirochaetota bacterium]
MCGIIGYIGSKSATEVILKGLKRLEYRGYDSAGIALGGSELFVEKTVGKLMELERALDCGRLSSYTMGIGHTRWATHGAPTRENAHPHCDCTGKIALVHNGIIENYDILKQVLIKEGHVFSSETDTEVIVHLIEHYHRSDSLVDSVMHALARVEGAYGIAVMSVKEPGVIVAARKGSPLILGIGDGEMVLASDASAIVDHTRSVIYIEDNEIMEITSSGYRTYGLDMKCVEKRVEAIDWDIASIEKKGFDHYMLKEIHEQSETIVNAYRGRIIPEFGNVRLDGLKLTDKDIFGIQRIIFIACGTSWHAGLIGEYLIEEYARIPVDVEYASEFRYRKPVLRQGDLVITISQSGETADTLAALR